MDGPCPKCGLEATEEGHDPCIAKLPGVLRACCGHGEQKGYIRFVDGRIFRFDSFELDENDVLGNKV